MSQHLYGACYAIIINKDGKVLLNKRQNTNYYDGGWTLVAGHIEQGEFASEAMIREIYEETGLIVTKENVSDHHVLQRIVTGVREYFDVSFVVSGREGIPQIMEPNKCTSLEWFSLDQLPDYIPKENLVFLNEYKKNPLKGGFQELIITL